MPNVLLVEPDGELAEIMATYLQPEFEVALKTDSQGAISRADDVKPDIIILELAISEHNGIAFLHELRSYPDWTNIPVIVYTRIPLESIGLSMTEWKKYGIVNYLYKPTVTLAQLAVEIRSELETSQSS